MDKIVHEKNYEQWSGLSEKYHNDRPIPPDIIVKIILSWLQRKPDTVVDIGCGTGLSTGIWIDIAKNVIGIEPNNDMRAMAERSYDSGKIAFRNGVSNESNLPADYADIVTVSQAFHWMDIDSTLIEFYRILKPGGVLAIYDFTIPPVLDWEVELSLLALRKKFSEIVYSQETPPIRNDKDTYNDRITSFGKFKHTRKVECHNVLLMSPQKAAEFHIGISNASFAVKADPVLNADVDRFFDFVNAKYKEEVEVIIPYKMVIAVK